ncbi:MAG: gas vesicle protein GvpJ [Candidatus Geothermarchaeales archaeon]
MSMLEPTRERGATIVNSVDRILDKGLVINADIVISVVGIPC